MALVTRGSPTAALLLRGLAGVLAGGALSWRDSLVDGTYSGKARFSTEGTVNGTSAYVDTEHPEVTLAMFWLPRGTQPGSEDLLVEQPGTAIRAEYYRSFELKLFDEPEARNLVTLASSARAMASRGSGPTRTRMAMGGRMRRSRSSAAPVGGC